MLLVFLFLNHLMQVVTGGSGQCLDAPNFNCLQISTLYNLCGDVSHAKTVCRDFCGLCDLVDGGWSLWNSWSTCDVTCSNGTLTRTRTCTNPSPAHGGLDCSGPNKQTSPCHMSDCPIFGGWSAWSPWDSCSVSCGVGLQSRDRSCSNPYPKRFGDRCLGDDKVYKTCFVRSCSDGAWSSWSAWDTCSATCNGGLQSRTRTCTNPAPSRLGRTCLGSTTDKQLCNNHNCPERKVGFSVYNPDTVLTSDGTPTFRYIILNTGSYNSTTGKFTSPMAGLYSFSLSLHDDRSSTSGVNCGFRINGVAKSDVWLFNEPWGLASGTMIANLDMGDVVDLKCGGWEHGAFPNSDSKFSGVLITAA